MSPHKKRTTKLEIEALELRDNPSTTAALIQGTVYIWGDSVVNNNVTIARPNLLSNLKITDNLSQKTWTIPQGFLDHTPVVFYGGSSLDKVTAKGAWNPVTLNGYGGNDVLTGGLLNDKINGGAGNDNLHGGAGNDFMVGGIGNDALFGQADIDYVDGEAGNDFLDDGGSAADVSKGGNGFDFLAKRVTVNGTTANDVEQEKTPTCGILAPIAAAAKAGINLGSRITYLGEGVYQVKLLHANGGSELQKVSLAGGMLDFEPTPQGEESWVILYHRAIQQARGQGWDDLYDYSSVWPEDTLSYLTGRPITNHGGDKFVGGNFQTAGDAEMTVIKNEMAAGHLVVVTTRKGHVGEGHEFGDVSTPKLAVDHVFAVESLSMNARTITLRNPWHIDVDISKGGVPTGDPNDGLVTITFDQFYASMWNYTTS